MRKVPELRFDGFEGEWEEVQLGTEADVRDGTHDSPKYVNKGYPLITSKNIINGKLNFDDISFISKEDFFLINKRSKVDIGDIIMPMIGTIGNPTILNRDDFAIKNVALIKKSNNLNNQFLLNLLNSKVFSRYLYIENAGGTQKFIALGIIREFLFNRPTIEEQEKIGDLFRKIDNLIEIQEGKVAKMRDYKKSMLQKMFPKKGELVPEFRFYGFDGEWKENKLSEIGDTYTSLSGKTAEDFGHGEAYYVTYMNVYKNSIADINDLGNIEIDNKQNEVLNGDFFFTTSSETPEEVGLSSAWIYDKSNVYLNSFCFGFRPIINIDTSFFAYFFRSENFRRKVVMLAQGSTRFNISKKYMMEITVRYPSLEEQQIIGQFFKNLDTQIENEEKLLESYKMMKKSLLQKMFV